MDGLLSLPSASVGGSRMDKAIAVLLLLSFCVSTLLVRQLERLSLLSPAVTSSLVMAF